MYNLRGGKPFCRENPRIIVPVCEGDVKEALKAAKQAAAQADMIELRADYFNAPSEVVAALAKIRETVKDAPLIFTFRSSDEGGVRDIDEAFRLSIIEEAAKGGLADFADIELSSGGDALYRIKEAARKGKSRLIVSYHDFSATPSEAAILEVLRAERDVGADCAKIAVTPQSPADVLTLLSASYKFHLESNIPFIAVSMGGLGAVSRVCGHVFGSCATFGYMGKKSAPGQISVGELKSAMALYKGNL